MAKKNSWHVNLRYVWQPTIFDVAKLRAKCQYRVSRDVLVDQRFNGFFEKRDFISQQPVIWFSKDWDFFEGLCICRVTSQGSQSHLIVVDGFCWFLTWRLIFWLQF
jgi:hypothetical protein